MTLSFDYRIGNIVDYEGPLGHFRNVRILDIKTFDDGGQMFTLEKSYEKGKTFAGYTENIKPVLLTEGILSRLGFQFEKEIKRHRYMNLMIGSFSYAEGEDPWHLTYVSLGFRIIPNGFPINPTVDLVKEETSEVPYLHVLQNYCSEKAIENIDFSAIN